ncbi:unnamed protein product [Urochloa humidicola]
MLSRITPLQNSHGDVILCPRWWLGDGREKVGRSTTSGRWINADFAMLLYLGDDDLIATPAGTAKFRPVRGARRSTMNTATNAVRTEGPMAPIVARTSTAQPALDRRSDLHGAGGPVQGTSFARR